MESMHENDTSRFALDAHIDLNLPTELTYQETVAEARRIIRVALEAVPEVHGVRVASSAVLIER